MTKKFAAAFVFGFVAAVLCVAQTWQQVWQWEYTQYGLATAEIRADTMRASHPDIPFGSRVRVVNTSNNREVEVFITGRIQASADRVIDLSTAAASELELRPGDTVVLGTFLPWDGITAHELSRPTDTFVVRNNAILVERLMVPQVLFAPYSASLTQGLAPRVVEHNLRLLTWIANLLKINVNYHVSIQGHANPTTPPGTPARLAEESEVLYALSRRRAQAVADFFISLGVDASKISLANKGSNQVIIDFTDTGNWWQNRRVEFFLSQ